MVDKIQILLCIIAGTSILNGIFMIIFLKYISFELKNIWMVEMFMVDAISPVSEEDAEDVSTVSD